MILSSKSHKKPLRDKRIEELVKAYLAGDKSKFSELHAVIEPLIKFIVKTRSKTSTSQDREDYMQECWLKALTNLAKWNPERGTLKNFLFACFTNKIICLFRAKKDECHLSESMLENLVIEQEMTAVELQVELSTRFTEPAEKYIMQNVGVAMYLKTYDKRRERLKRELYRITRMPRARISFLMDYTAYKMRKFSLENKWNSAT